jgi:signal transduction histidine kinase
VSGTFDHVRFHSDGHRILQILRNLVGNGLRYAQSCVRVHGTRVGGHIRIAVFNDGPPISPGQAERIFEPFVGTKREGGMGLGLAIGRELAWALGGNLRCLERATGAEFELTLPLEPPDFGR